MDLFSYLFTYYLQTYLLILQAVRNDGVLFFLLAVDCRVWHGDESKRKRLPSGMFRLLQMPAQVTVFHSWAYCEQSSPIIIIIIIFFIENWQNAVSYIDRDYKSKSSRYIYLYSDRVKKFLSIKCPRCTGSCLSWTRCLSWYSSATLLTAVGAARAEYGEGYSRHCGTGVHLPVILFHEVAVVRYHLYSKP